MARRQRGGAVRAVALALLVLLSGCASLALSSPSSAPSLSEPCEAAPQPFTFFFAAGHRLQQDPAEAGSEPGNAFSSGFLTNDLKEWLSDPVASGLLLEGNVTLDYWVESTGTPAPLVIGGDPGEGYHFFNQFGSNRTLQPGYAVEYSSAAPLPGTVDHYTESIALPAGGFVLERGDQLRVILTDLALDGPDGSGHLVHYGGERPSSVSFTARCWQDRDWPATVAVSATTVELRGNQGLLTGAVPAGPHNQYTFAFELLPITERLTITLEQSDPDANPVKDDIDLELIGPDGDVYGIGSPYSDEAGTLWRGNLEALGFGPAQVRVNSYSGLAYRGFLQVVQEIDDL